MKKFWLLFSFFFAFILVCPFFGCEKRDAITEYKIDCELNDNILTGEETVDFYNSYSQSLKEIKFNLYPNAYRKNAKYTAVAKEYFYSAYYNGESYGGIEILSVANANMPLDYSITGVDQNILSVNLKDELFPNERIKIVIKFKVVLANVISRTGITEKSINLADFYPIVCGITNNGFYECVYYSNGDPFYSDSSNYLVKFTVDKQFNVAYSGTIINKKELNEKVTYIIKANKLKSFALVLSEQFECIEKNLNGISLRYFFINDENPIQVISAVEKAVVLFEERFGEFPYESFSVCQTQFLEGGMEYSGLVYISDELLDLEKIEVAVHETAHQWWQSGVGNNGIEHAFLDEGLCEFSVALFFENYAEYNFSYQDIKKSANENYRLFCSVYNELFGEIDASILRPVYKFSSRYEYVSISYVKSFLMLDSLREIIGDKNMFSGLKDYYNRFKFKNATPDDFTAVFLKTFKESEGFFKGFLLGKAIL